MQEPQPLEQVAVARVFHKNNKKQLFVFGICGLANAENQQTHGYLFLFAFVCLFTLIEVPGVLSGTSMRVNELTKKQKPQLIMYFFGFPHWPNQTYKKNNVFFVFVGLADATTQKTHG